MFERRITILLVLVFTTVACEGKSCRDAVRSTTGTSKPSVPAAFSFVPQDARGVIRADEASGLFGFGAAIVGNLPSSAPLAITRKEWRETLGFDVFDGDGWAEWGVDASQPVTMFHDGERWAAHFPVAESTAVKAWVEAAKTNDELVVEPVDVGRADAWRISLPPKRGSAPLAYVMHARERLLVLPVGRLQPRPWVEAAIPPPTDEEIVGRLSSWLSLPIRRTWWTQSWSRKLHQAVSEDYPVHGIVKPGAWLKDVETTGHAGDLMRRISGQMGATAFGLKADVTTRRVHLHLRSRSDPRQPAFVEKLGGARGELPEVGGIVSAGVLAMVRLSVDPKEFYRLLRSALTPDGRRRLDVLHRELEKEFGLDLRKTLLENLDGHAVIAIYGFDGQTSAEEEGALASRIFRLEATREAIFLPIQDPEPVLRALDIWTQLSQGRLNRQALGNDVQYAWIEDGSLEWAVLVASDHMIVVDSSAAFEHAMIHQRSPRPLADSLRQKGVDDLLKGTDRSGLYLDVRSLSNILAETGNPAAAAWLRPFRWLILETEMEGKTDVVDVEMELAANPSAGPARDERDAGTIDAGGQDAEFDELH